MARSVVVDYVPDISEAGEVLGFLSSAKTSPSISGLKRYCGSKQSGSDWWRRCKRINLERQVQERTAQLQQALNFEVILKRITDKVRGLDEGQILQTAVQELAKVFH